MYDDDDPRKQIVVLLPTFCAVMRSAMKREAHPLPTSMTFVTPDKDGTKSSKTVSFDFTKRENLSDFDKVVLPMVRSMLVCAQAHEMTAFTAPFEEPVLSYAVYYGVFAFSQAQVEAILNPANSPRAPLKALLADKPQPPSGP